MTDEHTATVSSKGQVVVPADIRRHLGLVQGSVLRFVVEADNTVRLLPAAAGVQRLKGRLAKPAKPVSLADMQWAIDRRRRGIATAS